MSVNDESEHPWLVAEKRLIREAVQAGVGYWGACLGVQLLASSLGARVYAGPQPEVGVLAVTLTDEGASDPVFAGLPRELATLQWHGDTFDLPEGAVLLAESPAYPHQAFRYGRAAYGVQFHVEVTGDMAREWATVPAYVEIARADARGGCCAGRCSTSSTAPRPACSWSHVRCSSGGSMSQSPPLDNRLLALRSAAQEATDFALGDDQVRRFMALRDAGTGDDEIAAQMDARRRDRDRAGARRRGAGGGAPHRHRRAADVPAAGAGRGRAGRAQRQPGDAAGGADGGAGGRDRVRALELA